MLGQRAAVHLLYVACSIYDVNYANMFIHHLNSVKIKKMIAAAEADFVAFRADLARHSPKPRPKQL